VLFNARLGARWLEHPPSSRRLSFCSRWRTRLFVTGTTRPRSSTSSRLPPVRSQNQRQRPRKYAGSGHKSSLLLAPLALLSRLGGVLPRLRQPACVHRAARGERGGEDARALPAPARRDALSSLDLFRLFIVYIAALLPLMSHLAPADQGHTCPPRAPFLRRTLWAHPASSRHKLLRHSWSHCGPCRGGTLSQPTTSYVGALVEEGRRPCLGLGRRLARLGL